jgi:predicted transcriptional regulator
MSASTTLTVRVSPEVKKRLGQLAERTQRTKSYLAAEAIAGFVDRELAIIAGIKRGIDDMQAGRVIPHKQAMRRLRATATRAAKARA